MAPSSLPSSRKWRILLLMMAGTFTLVAGCAASTSNQEPAGPDRVEQPLWYPVADDMFRAPGPARRIESHNYRTLGLNRKRLAELLAQAPRERPAEARKSDVEIELPWPDGSVMRFRVEEAAIVEPGLTVRCPELKTYRGRTLDGSSYAHFEWSTSGFNARVSSREDVVYIRPYSRQDTRYYVVYYERDHGSVPEEGAPAPRPTAPSQSVTSPTPTGAAGFEEVSIERRCFACENQYKLTFRRDGSATLMTTGVLSRGSFAYTCTGRVPPQAFAELAALVHRGAFLALNEKYFELPDGAVVTSVIFDGQRKTVANSSLKAPQSLKAIEDAIDALGERISWHETRP